jgi:hypothetical protein
MSVLLCPTRKGLPENEVLLEDVVELCPTRPRMRTLAQMRADAIRLQPHWPICFGCSFPFHPQESDPLYGGRCLSCGINAIEQAFRRLVEARTAAERRAALKRILRLARQARDKQS